MPREPQAAAPTGHASSRGGDGQVARLAFVLAVATVATLGALALLRSFRYEEIYHTHAAWQVAQGRVPYRDFFVHHHPLLYYLLAALLPLLGESSGTLIALRLALLPLALGCLWATFHLALATCASREAAWLAVVLLGSAVPFLETFAAVRPDAPMILAQTLALLLLVHGLSRQSRLGLAGSGAALAVAILFQAKATLMGPAVAAALLVWRFRCRPRVDWIAPVCWAAGLALPLAAFGAWLVLSGAAADYAWAHGTFNAILTAELARVPTTGLGLVVNAPLWALFGAGMVAATRGRTPGRLAALAVVPVLVLLSLAALRAVRLHYLAQLVPSACVLAAWAAHAGIERAGLRGSLRWLMLAVVFTPLVALGLSQNRTHAAQRATIDHVLDRSAPDEPAFDPASRFNLFRPDLHHFGGVPTDRKRALDWYRRAAGPRYRPYDPCPLVLERRPRFVSDDGSLAGCPLSPFYGPSGHHGLLERVD